jgi:glutaredoxin 3
MSTFVDPIVKQHKVAVFSKTYCPYCDKAKSVLKKYHINDIKIIELDDRSDASDIQDYLAKITGARSVS